MVMDLHAHTYFSKCGADEPRDVVMAALGGGVDVLGITDHNHGINRPDEWGDRKQEYFRLLTGLKEEFAGQITLLRGIEIATLPGLCPAPEEDFSGFDYALIEHIDLPESLVGLSVFSFARRLGCPAGIAHTDLFAMAQKEGQPPEVFLRRFADAGIFWEMNVNFDSIHGYREHAYVQAFLQSEAQQEAVRKSGIALSVGFDGHRVGDYDPGRVASMCRFLEEKGMKTVSFEK